MKWSLKKKPTTADVILPSVKKKGLFGHKAKARLSTEDAETVDVVSVMSAEYPPREPDFDGADALSRVEPVLEAVLERENTALPDATKVEVEPVSDAAVEAAPTDKPKKSLWSKTPKKEKEPKPARSPKVKPEKAPAAAGPRPLKVLIGYLPDSSERDTYYYMLGVAEKNLDSENIGFAGLTKFENGYAYEIHEGGAGRGFLESILSHFKQLPAFSAEETHRAFIRTATRTVRVERTPAGIYSVILPEYDETPQSEWVVPGKKLSPLVDKRTGLFVAGIVIFLSSIVALMGGYATRYQPYTASVVNIERVPITKLPFSQWNKLMNLAPGDYVMALKYDKGEWLVQTPSNPSGRTSGSAKAASGKGGPKRPAPAAAMPSPGKDAIPQPGKDAPVTTSVTAATPAVPARAEAPTKPAKPRQH